MRSWWDRIDWDEVLNLANLVPENPNELYHASRRGIEDIRKQGPTHPLAREVARGMPTMI